jgi:DNA polymerase
MSCCGRLSDSDRADEFSRPFCICKKRGDEFKSGLWGYSEKMGAPLTRDQAHGAVRAYRAKYWSVTNFWRGVENIAIEAAIGGTARTYLGIVFGAVPQKFLWVKLPSGRRLHYLGPQVRHGEHGLELTHESYGLGWQRQKLYGGLLTENLVQSISRDILAEGMLRADEDGLTIVGHTHDEIICLEPGDSSNALDRLIAVMTQPISWAPNLRLKAEGYEGTVYKK